ncbi:hypothetical protein AHAS_Ahas04G0135200 [Arachis hypogaea]
MQLRDFMFDNTLTIAFVERWHLETHTFHLPWDECSIMVRYFITYKLTDKCTGSYQVIPYVSKDRFHED